MRDDDVVPEAGDEHDLLEELADKVRGIPAGLADPNIIGDVGPTDIPPGSDPHEPGELLLGEGEGEGEGELEADDPTAGSTAEK
jgi:hypothetical protein